MTGDGYVDFKPPPDNAVPPGKVEHNRDTPDGRNNLCAPPSNALRPSDTVFCFALESAT
jgi:hypothetical protein